MRKQLIIELVCFIITAVTGSNYYDILGLSKASSDQEIRQAFKKLALKLHPDKNQGDPTAQEKFLKVKKAYEVLKDSDLRRKYDLYGEKGLEEGSSNQFHSWSHYEKSFGLYDDDQEVITLTSADFYQSVTSSNDFWFVNFYSPGCSHCHTIAPAWREFAANMDGVIRVGAVNCQEEWDICANNGIQSYPSLVFYPSGERAYGANTADDLDRFVLSRLPRRLISVRDVSIFFSKDESHLLFFCQDANDEDCPSDRTREKLAIVLDGLANVGVIFCSSSEQICKTVGISSGSAYFSSNEFTADAAKIITSLSFRDIVEEIFSLLPDAPLLSQEQFEAVASLLGLSGELDWFVTFRDSTMSSVNEDPNFKRLPALLRELKHVALDCSQLGDFCQEYKIDKFPSYGIYKRGGGFELVWGKEKLQDVIAFAKESAKVPNLVTLNPELLNEAIAEGKTWVVDFFAPWCPPCKRILPVVREASRLLSETAKFGTFDCVKFSATCSQLGVRSYPSLVLFNNTAQYQYHGDHNAGRVADFVKETLNPPAIQMTLDKFESLVETKSKTEIWLVDFYASWCGPCQHLKPHWAKVAKSLAPLSSFVHVAEVDCVKEPVLCRTEGINAYPTIRMYPQGHLGKSAFIPFSENQRDHHSILSWIVRMIPSNVVTLTANSFDSEVLRSPLPWVVEFYLPWCGPCQIFAPHYEIAAKALQGKINFAKINCDHFGHICQQAGIRGYPAVRMYSGRKGNSDVQNWVGKFVEARDASTVIEQVTDFIMSETPGIMHDEL